MTRLLSILLLTGFLLQNFSKVMVFINYAINKEYIAKNLCENKSKPKLHCNGKCQLKKELQKQDKKEDTPSNIKDKYEIQLFSEIYDSLIVCSFLTGEQVFRLCRFSIHSFYVFSFFHPPSFR